AKPFRVAWQFTHREYMQASRFIGASQLLRISYDAKELQMRANACGIRFRLDTVAGLQVSHQGVCRHIADDNEYRIGSSIDNSGQRLPYELAQALAVGQTTDGEKQSPTTQPMAYAEHPQQLPRLRPRRQRYARMNYSDLLFGNTQGLHQTISRTAVGNHPTH